MEVARQLELAMELIETLNRVGESTGEMYALSRYPDRTAEGPPRPAYVALDATGEVCGSGDDPLKCVSYVISNKWGR